MTSRITPKNGEDKVQLTTYLTPLIKDQFKQKCQTEGSCASVKVRQLIYEYLK